MKVEREGEQEKEKGIGERKGKKRGRRGIRDRLGTKEGEGIGEREMGKAVKMGKAEEGEGEEGL